MVRPLSLSQRRVRLFGLGYGLVRQFSSSASPELLWRVRALVMTAALFERFASRDQDVFQNKVLSAMRLGFGGHAEKKS